MVVVAIKWLNIFLIALSYLHVFASCSDRADQDGHLPVDEITAADVSLIPDKEAKTVAAMLTFKNIEQIDHLLVRKSGGSSYSRRINHDELSSSYRLVYSIEASDPTSFNLVLSARYKDGNTSKEFVLNVDNRWGFFVRSVDRLARVTGRPLRDEPFPTPVNTATDWNVGGTDLGIIWEMETGHYGIFFGDTYGNDFVPKPSNPGPNGGSWRCNVLGFSSDTDLTDGFAITRMAEDNGGNAREIIEGGRDQSGNGDWTSIPTAAIRANGHDYVHYFNLKSWTGWVTNFSGMYKSTDNGQNWSECEGVRFAANSGFGQVGYFKKDGYVYMIGTETGRDSPARLARFRESDIENQEAYAYWNSDARQWLVGDEAQATVIIDDKVGELSFIYNHKHQKWIIAYFNADRYNITMRTAEELTGPWSEPYELASGSEYPQLYGSYFHPLSVSGDDLYFTMSMWMPYNVFLMKAELADMGEF